MSVLLKLSLLYNYIHRNYRVEKKDKKKGDYFCESKWNQVHLHITKKVWKCDEYLWHSYWISSL